jgi:hypothetical protein
MIQLTHLILNIKDFFLLFFLLYVEEKKRLMVYFLFLFFNRSWGFVLAKKLRSKLAEKSYNHRSPNETMPKFLGSEELHILTTSAYIIIFYQFYLENVALSRFHSTCRELKKKNTALDTISSNDPES